MFSYSPHVTLTVFLSCTCGLQHVKWTALFLSGLQTAAHLLTQHLFGSLSSEVVVPAIIWGSFEGWRLRRRISFLSFTIPVKLTNWGKLRRDANYASAQICCFHQQICWVTAAAVHESKEQTRDERWVTAEEKQQKTTEEEELIFLN